MLPSGSEVFEIAEQANHEREALRRRQSLNSLYSNARLL